MFVPWYNVSIKRWRQCSMGRKPSVITLTAEERDYLETQTRARTIQAQTVNRARILLLKADGCSIDDISDTTRVS